MLLIEALPRYPAEVYRQAREEEKHDITSLMLQKCDDLLIVVLVLFNIRYYPAVSEQCLPAFQAEVLFDIRI